LAKQEKVTSCWATPGGFDFYFDVGLREKTANPTYALHHRAAAASRRPFDRLRANGFNKKLDSRLRGNDEQLEMPS
jgi:hypothetical protein